MRDLSQYEEAISWLESHGCEKFKVKSSGDLMCTCPLHDDRSPSFSLKIAEEGSGYYHCFGCGAKGTLRDLVAKLEGGFGDFRVVGNITRGFTKTSSDTRRNVVQTSKFDLSTLSRYNVLHPYWGSRGIQPESISKFMLGYSSENYSVTIPVRSLSSGEVQGVCFRYIDSDKNSPDLLKQQLLTGDIQRYHYSKGTLPGLSLFGLETIKTLDRVYVFEGAIDAINYHQRHNVQVLAKWGTLLTKQQIEYISRFKEVYIVADNDKSGVGIKSAKNLCNLLIGKSIVHVMIPENEQCKDYTEQVTSSNRFKSNNVKPINIF